MTDSISSNPPQSPKKKSNWKKPLLFGCLGFVVLGFIAVSLFTWWAATKGKAFVTEAARDGLVEVIVDSDLSEPQQQELIQEIDRLASGFEGGDITFEQMAKIIEEIGESPVFGAIKIYGAEAQILANSNITSEEKAQADQILRRYIFGVIEERIPQSSIDDLLDPLLLNAHQGNDFEFRNDITDEELRATITKAKAYADDAGIKNDEVDPNLAGQIRKIIDRVVGQ